MSPSCNSKVYCYKLGLETQRPLICFLHTQQTKSSATVLTCACWIILQMSPCHLAVTRCLIHHYVTSCHLWDNLERTHQNRETDEQPLYTRDGDFGRSTRIIHTVSVNELYGAFILFMSPVKQLEKNASKTERLLISPCIHVTMILAVLPE